ncbi:MAG TPA: class I SAM-dependent methyltransferase [Candidatus Bathyarchaeia archaeon]|nr:class I SAM-dependent methyltransferase [Candidatus Bathyarchaeia archaeon]
MTLDAPITPRYACRVCGGTGTESFRKRGFIVASCASCASRFVPDPVADLPSYDEGYFAGQNDGGGYPAYLLDRELIVENFARRIRWVKPLGRGTRLLDVGAAYGFLLVAARGLGYEVLGVEPAQGCADFARRELGVEILSGTLEEADLAEASFDVVTMFDVIEHLVDPAATLRRVHALLRPGGLFVVETGDVGALLARVCGRRWYYYDPPQHVTYFNQKSLADLLVRSGFSRPLAVGYLGKSVSLRNFAFQLGRSFGDGRLGDFSRAVSRSPLGRLTFPVPDRGNAFTFAVRRE